MKTKLPKEIESLLVDCWWAFYYSGDDQGDPWEGFSLKLQRRIERLCPDVKQREPKGLKKPK